MNSRSDGLEVLRFTNADVLTNSEGVEQMIYEKAEAALKQNTRQADPNLSLP